MLRTPIVPDECYQAGRLRDRGRKTDSQFLSDQLCLLTSRASQSTPPSSAAEELSCNPECAPSLARYPHSVICERTGEPLKFAPGYTGGRAGLGSFGTKESFPRLISRRSGVVESHVMSH